MQEVSAVDVLVKLLRDTQEDEMVRHEAAEALAAIGDNEAIAVISEFIHDESPPVRETCELALYSLVTKATTGASADIAMMPSALGGGTCTYKTVDPVQRVVTEGDVNNLREILTDTSLPLSRRYEALFGLRNLGTEESAKVLAEVLATDTSSALLRHEVAFVLGQLQRPSTFHELALCLSNVNEHPMARHEAALAVGSLGALFDCPKAVRDDCISLLEKYLLDVSQVVSESCVVGLHNIAEEASTGIAVQ